MVARIRANMPGGVDPQTVDTILLNKGSNPIVVRFDDGVVFCVDVHQGNLVVPHPALLLAEFITPVNCTVRVILFLDQWYQ